MELNLEGQKIENVEIEKEIKRSYLDYAMSVIVGRALPDVRDGMKPVHRRVLYSMFKDSLTHDKPFRKSATTVGNVLGHYHPHGDAAVYDTLVRMAQPFSLRYPLIEGHGNFGNVDGDGAAAYRYTEARMSRIADEMLGDIDKNVVDFVPNFDNKLTEPTVLPSRFPNLLVNGSVGIAVGMATNIPAHNLSEVIDGTVCLIDDPDADIPTLMSFIKGPDFPTGGIIYGTSGIVQTYMTGRGRISVRAKHHFETHNNRTAIVFTEIPYQVNKSALVGSIVALVKDKRIEGIADLRDESDMDKGMRIVVEVKRDANPEIVLNLLFRHTQLQDTFAANMLALVDNEPKLLNLKQILRHYIRHQEEVVTRKFRFELDKALARLHILEGYKIAIDNIEEVIRIIRSSLSVPEAKAALMERFGLSDAQGQAIVDMPLGKLAGLEVDKILEEMRQKQELIDRIRDILSDEKKILAVVKEDLLEIKKRYGDERRTQIEQAEDDILIEDLIEKHKCVVTVTDTGYIKRIRADQYQAQNRGGKGINAMTTKEEDFVKSIIVAHSHSWLFMFTSLGRLYVKKVYEIPEAGRTAKGTNIVNILPLREKEEISAFISVSKIDTDELLTFVTRRGYIKRTPLRLFRHLRKIGVNAITLTEGDSLQSVTKTDGTKDVFVATNDGRCIRFGENEVSVMGRTARGVRAIRLKEDQFVCGTLLLDAASDKKLLTVTANGFGKRSEPDGFRVCHRGGMGITCHKLSEKTGELVGIAAVEDGDDVMLITDSGMLVRIPAGQISVIGRAAGGVILMRTATEAKVTGFEIVTDDDVDSVQVEEADEDELEFDDGAGEDDAADDAIGEEAIVEADDDAEPDDGEEDGEQQ